MRVGEGIHVPDVPEEFGQIERINRTRAVVLYRRGKRVCRRRYPLVQLAAWSHFEPLLFPTHNPMNRGVPTPAPERSVPCQPTKP